MTSNTPSSDGTSRGGSSRRLFSSAYTYLLGNLWVTAVLVLAGLGVVALSFPTFLSMTRQTAAAASMPFQQPAGIVTFDFDADGKADIGRWHGISTELKVKKSNGGAYDNYTLGSGSARLAPADFNGDGDTDAAVFNAGTWTIKTSTGATATTISLGQSGDIPVAGDYVGDGKADAAVFRPSNYTWNIKEGGTENTSSTAWGATGDIPVPGNYDGDGKMDLAVFRPSTGAWHIQGSTVGYISATWGYGTDLPVAADYDGDGKTDIAVFRPSNGNWYVLKSSTGFSSWDTQAWGIYSDQPVPADYDGDGKADYAVWRPASGVWFIIKSSNSAIETHTLGALGDTSLASAYLKQSSGQVTGDVLAAPRLSPRNATGGTDLYSQNFGWSSQLVSLPGRSGMNAGFGISYNSLVWTKDAANNAMYFDPDISNITPGFRFGFPVIEPVYYDRDKYTYAYMMVTPSGGRIEFRQTAASDTYDAADSSYLQLKTSGASNPNDPVEAITIKVTGTDGTQMSYEWKGGTFRCNQIKDRNGNYISIVHDDYGLLQTVTDTLGRVITVNYDAGMKPTSITQTWKDGNGTGSNVTHTWASFAYTTKEIATDFDGVTVVGPPNGTVINVLDKVTYADGSSTAFDYNGYAQVYKVRNIAADSATHVLNYVRTNLQSPAADQTDCPRFTHTYTWAENFNLVGGTPAEIDVENVAPASSSFTGGNGAESTKVVKVAMANHPDNLYSLLHFGPSGYREGLTLATEDCLGTDSNCGTRKRWTWNEWTQDNTGVSYPTNPRVIQSRVGDGSNTKKTTIDYRYDSATSSYLYGLPETVQVYDTDLSTVIKKSITEYNLDSNYTSRRIIGLPAEVLAYGRETSGLNLMSKVTYAYDEGSFSDSGLAQNISPVQHDNTNYGSSFVTGRGNLTKTTRWNAEYPTNSTYAVESSVKYNTAGSPVAQTDPRGRVSKVFYTDSWNDSVGRTTFAFPTTVTDAGGFSSTIQYRYDLGANVWARSPTPSGSGNSYGKTTSRVYDDTTGRITKEKIENSGAYTRYAYPTSGNAMTAYSTIIDVNADLSINSSDEVATETIFDGAGRVLRSRTANPNSTGGYTGRKVAYDILGRVTGETVPTEIDSSWDPAGDDTTWLWNTKEYDWKGRVTRAIHSDSNGTDGKDQLFTYEGCGCAGGQVTTIKGEITEAVDVAGNMQTTRRRTQKVYEDILGRVYKTEIWDLDGAGSAPYSTVKTTFNGRDQAVLVREYAGSDSSSTYQDTMFTFDGHGRPLTKHLPEYDTSAVTAWTYNADDTPATVTDARGAVVTYKYGHVDDSASGEYRALLTKVLYSSPNTTNIPDPADVTFAYDAAGNRISTTDGSGSLTYAYDELSRLKTETKDFADNLDNAPSGGVYTLSYNYHLTGGIASITEPFGSVISYTSDAVGRTTAIEGTGFGDVTSFATGISYRAFGGVKSMSYSTADATNITLTYDNRLRVSAYEAASNANVNSIQDKSYSYNPDGSINEAVDNLASNFTQYYDYDFAGRLKRNEFGTGNPGAGKPYKQLLGYDAFNNITSRQTWTWDFGEATFAAAYTNRRKTQGGFQSGTDYHDAAGAVVQNIVSSTSDKRAWKFEASGRTADWEERVPYLTTVRDDGAEMTYDGDGRVAKVIKRTRTWVGQDPQFGYTPEYNIYSSVTGQKITELNDTGEKQKTSIYLGTSVIAEQGCGISGCGVAFRNIDPVAGTIKSTDPSGTFNTADRIDLEPLGAMIPPEEEEVHTPQYNEHGYGFAGNPEMGCSGGIFNGPMPCNAADMEMRYEKGLGFDESERRKKKGQPIFDPEHGPELPDDSVFADNVRRTRKGFRRISIDTGLAWADGGKPIYEDMWVVDPSAAGGQPRACDVRWQLPQKGDGFIAKSNTERSKQYGNYYTIDYLQQFASSWAAMGHGQVIRVGEISIEGGGQFRPHKGQGHKFGIGVDIGLFNKQGLDMGGVSISDPRYDQEAMEDLIHHLLDDPNVAFVEFGEKLFPTKSTKYVYDTRGGHKDHIHVVFKTRCHDPVL